MYKWVMFGLFIAACLLAVGVMSFGPLAPQPKEHVVVEEDPNLVKIHAANWNFDAEEYRVKAGEQITLKLINDEGIHGISIDGTDINLDSTKSSQQITFDQPGEYAIRCSILCGDGHAGMVSKLIVE